MMLAWKIVLIKEILLLQMPSVGKLPSGSMPLVPPRMPPVGMPPTGMPPAVRPPGGALYILYVLMTDYQFLLLRCCSTLYKSYETCFISTVVHMWIE